MPQNKTDRRYLYTIMLLFILMVAIKAYFVLQMVNPEITPDEIIYSNMAQNIASGRFTSDVQFASVPPPGYPIFLSLADVSSNPDQIYHLMLFINCILSASILFPAFFILKKFIDEEEALYFSIVVSVLPSSLVYSMALMSENLFIPLFLFSAWFLLESTSRKSFLFDFLFGFSIFMLFLTRAIGIVLVFGIALVIIYKLKNSIKYADVPKSAVVMLLSFLLPFIAWYFYKTNNAIPQLSTQGFEDVSGYGIKPYLDLLVSAVSSMPSFLKFAGFFINEIDYLAIITFGAFLIFAVYSIYKRGSVKNMDSYRVFICYTCISALLMLIVTTVFMVSVSATQYTRNVLGRYIDPIVAPLFIMGVVGFYQFRKERDSLHQKDWYILAVLYVLTLLLFVRTFPINMSFVVPHLLSVSYLTAIDPYTSLYFMLLSLFIFSYMLLMPKNQVFLNLLLLALTIISLLISSFTFISFYPIPHEREIYYPIARYLEGHASSTTLTVFDLKELNDTDTFTFYLVSFWSKTHLELHQLNSSDVCNSGLMADYVVSDKALPYEKVSAEGILYLYRINCSNG